MLSLPLRSKLKISPENASQIYIVPYYLLSVGIVCTVLLLCNYQLCFVILYPVYCECSSLYQIVRLPRTEAAIYFGGLSCSDVNM